MKILNISRVNKNAAGSIAYTFHDEFLRMGHESRLLTMNGLSDSHNGVVGVYSPFELTLRQTARKIRHRLEKVCPSALSGAFGLNQKKNPDYCLHSIQERKVIISSKVLLRRFPFHPDVVILYFIDNFLNAENISDIFKATGARILWYFPDMAPMTGGCHYAWDCEGYKRLCGACPAIDSNNPEDITRKNMLYKQEHFKNLDLTALVGGDHHHRQIASSTLFRNKRIERVMVPIDENIFKPGDKEKACRRFAIPPDKKVLFFGAQSIAEKRKGMTLLLDALHILKSRIQDNRLLGQIHLLIAGKKIKDFETKFPFDYTYVGLLSQEDELPSAFQAADLFLCPSIEDSGPMMINQSIMSGTPVVAFEMGVALDLVHTGETGYRAILKDRGDFANGIKEIISLSKTEWTRMRERCRILGLAKGTAARQAKIIEEILTVPVGEGK